MPAKITTPSFLPEWETFRKNLPPNHPYERLLPDAAATGFDFDLEQVAVEGLADASVLVTFMVHIGKDGKFEPYRLVSMHLLSSIGPVTLAARLQVQTTLIHMFFGRLPPAPSEQTVDVGRQPEGDIKLPGEDPLPPDDEPEQEYVDAPPPRRGPKMPNLVDHVEPDGVPVFIDLDDVPNDFTSAQIVEQFLRDVDAAAVKFDSLAQLHALYTKNEMAIGFIKDDQVASDEDRQKLADLMERHSQRIEAAASPREVRIPGGKGSSVPRRRRAVA